MRIFLDHILSSSQEVRVRRIVSKFVALSVVFTGIFSLCEANAEPMRLIWKIISPDGSFIGHLYGEVHHVPKSEATIPKSVQKIYDASRFLVMESNAFDSEFFNPSYPEGVNYYDRLTPEALDLLITELSKGTKSKQQLLTLKPKLRPITMNFIHEKGIASLNFSDLIPPITVPGYSHQLSLQVLRDKKLLLTLESPYFYEKAYVPCDTRENNAMLVQSAIDWGKIREIAQFLLQPYDLIREGNLDQLEYINSIQRMHQGWQLYATCSLWVRHSRWRESLNKYVKEGKRDMFIIVGASHVFGQGNFRELMEKEGYKFERAHPVEQ
jgi:uncharacterized protein YbaP (TraB family)